MPKVVDHDAMRERLLDGSFEVLAAQGYAGVSMRGLARALGVSTGTLYHYFPDKEAILREMFARMSVRDIGRATAGTTPEEPTPARRARLLRFLMEEEAHLRGLVALALDVHRHEPGPGARETLRATLIAYRAALARELRLDEPRAALLITTLIGLLVHRTLDPDAPGPDALAPWLEVLAP